MAKASILVACRNCDKYLKQCLSSVTMQTYKDWEVIFVDDCSNDKSYRIAVNFAKSDSRIKLYRNDKKIGCGASYNKAAKLATGEISCVLDSDDALSSNTSLERLMHQYDDHPDVGYIWTQFFLCTPNLKKIKKGFSCHPGKRSLLEAGIDLKHCFSHWRTFRTELINKTLVFNPDLKACVDKWMGYSLEEVAKGGFYNKTLYMYRQRVGGLSYRGRKQWKIMKKQFSEKRKEKGIKVKEIVKL